MKTIIIGAILSLLATISTYEPNYQSDLISRNKSDSAVKFLKPPLSLTVLQNRPQKGFYYFFSNEESKFDEGLSGIVSEDDAFDKIISNDKVINKTLRATDPARLAPASVGADFRGVISRNRLKDLYKINPSDILLVYRREIIVQSKQEFSDSYFQTPELFLKSPDSDLSIKIMTKGLVYISKQKNILALPQNKQIVSVSKGQNDNAIILSKAVKSGLKKLAEEAKKKIRAQKKIITKSY